MENEKKWTWEKIIAIDSRLKTILEAAQLIKQAPLPKNFCRSRMYSAVFKYALGHWVGWNAFSPELRDSEAWDICVYKILDALPPCTHPGEFC